MAQTRIARKILLLFLAVLSGCGPSESIPRNFMRTIFSGNAKEAIEYLCVDGSVNAIVAIRADWSDDIYKELYSDDQSALYLVSGRLILTTENIEEYLPIMREVLVGQGYDVPEFRLNTDIGVSIQFGVNFDNFSLRYDDLRKEWCVAGGSYYDILRYLFQMIVDELSKSGW